MRKTSVFSFGLLILCILNIASAANLKVGVLDLKRVFTEAPQVAAIQAKLHNEFDPKAKELQELKKDYDVNIDMWKQNSATMKESEKRNLRTRIADLHGKLANLGPEFEKGVIVAKNQSMQSVFAQFQEAVNSVAKDKGINLVIVEGALVFNEQAFDITDDVLKILKK